MAFLIGGIVGGSLVIYLLSIFFEWLIVKRIADSPEVGIPASAALGVAIAIIIYGFGNANGGPWNPMPGGLVYIVPGIIVTGLRLLALKRRRAREGDAAEVFE